MDIQAYTQRGRSVIQAAQSEALTRDHQQMTPLHIMSGLLDEQGELPGKLIERSGADLSTFKTALETELSKLPECHKVCSQK